MYILGEFGGEVFDYVWRLECGERFRGVFLKELLFELSFFVGYGYDEVL